MTRVIVTGSRDWYARDLAVRVVGRMAERYGRENLTIVTGGGRADAGDVGVGGDGAAADASRPDRG